jgi:integrase
VRLRKRGKTWFAIYWTKDGKRVFRSTKCSDQRAAESVGRRWEREAQDPDPAATNTTTLGAALEKLIDHYEELIIAGRRADGTLGMHRDKAGHLRRVFEYDAASGELIPFSLLSLTAGRVDDYISQRRADGAAENTIAKELVTLRCTLKLAKRRGEFFGDIEAIMPHRFAPEYKPRERWLTADELHKLLAKLPPDHGARAAFAVATSANRGETFSAMREDLGEAVFVRGTKRTSRRRRVPLVTNWQRLLLEYAAKHAQGEDGKLFAFDGGFHTALLQGCEDAGIAPCSSNDLRRTFCHWMRQSGIPRELVAAAMGHGSTAMVDKVYGKLDARELADLMQRALGGSGTPVAQTHARQAQSSDSANVGSAEKPNDSGAGDRSRTDTPFRATDFESVCRRLPPPRDYETKRDYRRGRGTQVAQRKAAEVIPIPRLASRGGGR